MAPTVLIVPGIWIGPKPFYQVRDLVTAAGLKVDIATLPSTGTRSPGNPSMKDDIASLRKHLESILARGEDVTMVLHSAGGFMGGAAADGLTKKERGEKSGVVNAVLVTAACVPPGTEHSLPPFAYEEDGAMLCKNPGQLLYNDLPESERSQWLAELQSQPAQDWHSTIPYAPWQHLPSTYVLCERDEVLPPTELCCAGGE